MIDSVERPASMRRAACSAAMVEASSVRDVSRR
jgi:hypothetical protein